MHQYVQIKNVKKYVPIKNVVTLKVVPVHEQEDKNLIKIITISLLTIFGKVFERVIYNSLFNYFTSNKFFTLSQSGFLPGDSRIAHLLSITHEIKTALVDLRLMKIPLLM